jgi:hypothetical protein
MEPARALPVFDANPISEKHKRKIVRENAVKLYGQRLISQSGSVIERSLKTLSF